MRKRALAVLAALLVCRIGLTHEEQLVAMDASWSYLEGSSPPPSEWNELSFDDSAWSEGGAGLGYGDDGLVTTLEDMRGQYASVYLRREFDAEDVEHFENLWLDALYDDGFVAYLNGVEVARRALGAPGAPTSFDSLAESSRDAWHPEPIDLSAHLDVLLEGTNLLAVEVHNYALNSTDLTFSALLVGSRDPNALPVSTIPQGATWRYFKGTQEPPADWNEPAFDDGDWLSGPTIIGYGRDDEATVLDDMIGNYLSVYARKTFTVADPAEVRSLVLRLRYDDGFVAYLNGVEILRRGMGPVGSPTPHDEFASLANWAGAFESFDLTSEIGRLRTGENVLAFQVHNNWLGSIALTLDPVLDLNVERPPNEIPRGFTDEVLAAGFTSPVALRFLPDGSMLVAEKRGVVWKWRDGDVLAQPFLDLQDEVNNAGDRGLLSLEVDRDYAENGFVYALYVVDPEIGLPEEPAGQATFGRLTRYTADTAVGEGDAADLASRRIILGEGASDGIPICDESHSMGDVRMASDGSLIVSAGDGAHFDFVDAGQDVTPFDPGCDALFGSAEDVGAFRSQRLDSLAGKVLRIDAATGEGLSDNPFFDGDPTSARSRVWALGLRNPFRLGMLPGTGTADTPETLLIGDVGWSNWEEINLAEGGENFGWPCLEGPAEQPLYQTSELSASLCDEAPQGDVTAPLITWHHFAETEIGFNGNCTVGGEVYLGGFYPPEYQGALFFPDYDRSWLRVAVLDESNDIVEIGRFGTNVQRPVAIASEPTRGDLVYVSISSGEVRRISFDAANARPSARAFADPIAGAPPLEVRFSGSASSDPEGGELEFSWDFGDGSPLSSEPDPVHVYEEVGDFRATLTVSDPDGNSDSATVDITTSNTAPTVRILTPSADTRFFGGEIVTLTAEADDEEDGPLTIDSWEVVLHHNSHVHPDWLFSREQEPQLELESHGSTGDSFYYEIVARVVDSGGLQSMASVEVRPGSIRRGDGNGDGRVDIGDAIAGIFYLFVGDPLACPLAMDADGRGIMNLSDPIYMLQFLFRGGSPPAAPYPDCGVAANVTDLRCDSGCAD